MSSVSLTTPERARKIEKTIFKAISEPGKAAAVATSMGVGDATISRLKNEHLENFSAFLAHLGLKVVPVDVKCFSESHVTALLTLAKAHMKTIQTVESLDWDD